MKKVNVLIGLLYLNNLISLVFNLHFIDAFVRNIIGSNFISFNFDFIYVFIMNIHKNITGADYITIETIFANLLFIFLLWFILFLVFSIVNIISVILDFKNNESEILFLKMKIIKIGLIPFWVINFILYFPITYFLLTVGRGFGLIFAFYMLLLLTSIFSILYLFYLHRNNIIQKKEFIVHTIIQLLFVFDTIDVIYIIKKWRVNLRKNS